MACELEPLWDAREVCARLRVARSTLYEWVNLDFIPHVRIGGCVRFQPSALVQWLNQQAKPGRARRVPATEV